MIAEQVYAATEPHRLACEARHVLRLPLAERRAYLAEVERARGPEGAQVLRQAVTEQWRAARQAREVA